MIPGGAVRYMNKLCRVRDKRLILRDRRADRAKTAARLARVKVLTSTDWRGEPAKETDYAFAVPGWDGVKCMFPGAFCAYHILYLVRSAVGRFVHSLSIHCCSGIRASCGGGGRYKIWGVGGRTFEAV